MQAIPVEMKGRALITSLTNSNVSVQLGLWVTCAKQVGCQCVSQQHIIPIVVHSTIHTYSLPLAQSISTGTIHNLGAPYIGKHTRTH